MPWIPFVNDKLNEELTKLKGENEKSAFPEHEFLATCIKFGFTIQDLKQLTYVEVMKTLYTQIETKTKRATQKDWDRLAQM